MYNAQKIVTWKCSVSGCQLAIYQSVIEEFKIIFETMLEILFFCISCISYNTLLVNIRDTV